MENLNHSKNISSSFNIHAHWNPKITGNMNIFKTSFKFLISFLVLSKTCVHKLKNRR